MGRTGGCGRGGRRGGGGGVPPLVLVVHVEVLRAVGVLGHALGGVVQPLAGGLAGLLRLRLGRQRGVDLLVGHLGGLGGAPLQARLAGGVRGGDEQAAEQRQVGEETGTAGVALRLVLGLPERVAGQHRRDRGGGEHGGGDPRQETDGQGGAGADLRGGDGTDEQLRVAGDAAGVIAGEDGPCALDQQLSALHMLRGVEQAVGSVGDVDRGDHGAGDLADDHGAP